MRYPIITCLYIPLLIGQLGCALGPRLLPPPPSEETRARLGTVGIVSARFPPEADFEGKSRGKEYGAAVRGTQGALGAATLAALIGLAAAAGCGPFFPICAPIFAGAGAVAGATAGGVVGAVSGAGEAEPAERIEEAKAALKTALTDLKIQEAMRDQVAQVVRDQTRHRFVLLTEQGPTALDEEINYSSLEVKGIDAVLELSVPTVGFEGGGGINPLLALSMNARARLIRVRDNTVLYAHTFEHSGGSRTFTKWAADNALPSREALERGYRDLAEQIVDEIFLVYGPGYMLRAEYPEDQDELVEVDSTTPTLRWESFPRPLDREADKLGVMNGISEVTYDLRIWRAESDSPLVYARQGLPAPSHRIETPLELSTEYFWTFRARFKLDGHPRVTEWGTRGQSDRRARAPNPDYYRFKILAK